MWAIESWSRRRLTSINLSCQPTRRQSSIHHSGAIVHSSPELQSIPKNITNYLQKIQLSIKIYLVKILCFSVTSLRMIISLLLCKDTLKHEHITDGMLCRVEMRTAVSPVYALPALPSQAHLATDKSFKSHTLMVRPMVHAALPRVR